METIKLRRAEPKDAPYILDITRRAFEIYAAEVRKREKITALFETIDDVLHDIEHINVFVCEIDGEIVGSVRFEERRNKIAYLSRFGMDPDIQNLGIGGLLLEKVRMECLSMGLSAITLKTASRMRSSVSFYLKNGYYIHSIDKQSDYIRAFMVNELKEMDELFDYEGSI